MIFNVPGHIAMIRNGLFNNDPVTSRPDYSIKAIEEYFMHRAQFLADRQDVSKEVKEGLYPLIIKTQTRRVNRGIYQVGKDYAVQSKRGVKAEIDIRIEIDEIHAEGMPLYHATALLAQKGGVNSISQSHISVKDALAEGGYIPEEYEKAFRDINPKWHEGERWAYIFM